MAQIVKRRGKDLTLNWAIKTNGAETALAGRDLTLVRTSPCGHSVKMTWTSEGNKLIFHFRGRKQVECGSYKFTLWENLGKNGQSVVDCTDQLQLVESTELEQEGNADNLEVESVDLTSADVVLGAKGADGRGIVSMVQTLSSTASGGKNAVTITYTDGTTAVFEFYNGARGEDADIEGCEEAISSANDARDEALAQVEACKAELATLRNDYTTKYQALANDYAGVKASLTSAYNSELATLRSDYSDVKGALQTDYRTTKSSLSSDYTAKANALASRYAELQTALQTDYNDKLTTLNSQYTADVNAIKNRYDAEVTSAKASMETKLSQIQTACNNAIGAVNTKLVEYNSDHDTAVSDHSIANADHNTALSDHNIASTDHNTASTDHNTASADHATAVSDHSKVSGAEKVNAVLSGRTITVTDRQGVSKSVTVPEGGSGGSGVTSYNDLTDKPTIPTKTSQLTNDSGFATIGVDIATLRDDINGKVDKVEGKGLSTNDYTTADKNKVAQVEDLVTNIGQLSNLQTTEKSNLVGAINEAKNSSGNAYTKSETDAKIAQSLGAVESAMQNLPDGSAVSAQVAVNTTNITKIAGKEGGDIAWNTTNGYINVKTTNAIGDVISTDVVSYNSYRSVVVECAEGDKFKYTGRSNNHNSHAWAWLDKDKKLLLADDSFATKYSNKELVAPVNASYLVLQTNYAEWNELGGTLPYRYPTSGRLDNKLGTDSELTTSEAETIHSILKTQTLRLNNSYTIGKFNNASNWTLVEGSSFVCENNTIKIYFADNGNRVRIRSSIKPSLKQGSKLFFYCECLFPHKNMGLSIMFNKVSGYTTLQTGLVPTKDVYVPFVIQYEPVADEACTMFDITPYGNVASPSTEYVVLKNFIIGEYDIDDSISASEFKRLCMLRDWFEGDELIINPTIINALNFDLEDELSVYVGDGGDFKTLSSALAYISKYHPSYKYSGLSTRIIIKQGTTINEQILAEGIDLSHIIIEQEGYNPEDYTYDDVCESVANGTLQLPYVPVSASGFLDITHDTRGDVCLFRAENGGRLPQIGCIFKLVDNPDNKQVAGIVANRGSEAIVRTLCGFDGFYDGVISNNESTITIREGITMNCSRWGCHSRHNGEVSARSVIATGCDSIHTNESAALCSDRIADLDGREAWISAGGCAFRTKNTSRMNCNGAHIIGSADATTELVSQYISLANYSALSVVGKIKFTIGSGGQMLVHSYDTDKTYAYNTISADGIIFH